MIRNTYVCSIVRKAILEFYPATYILMETTSDTNLSIFAGLSSGCVQNSV